jgi:RHS repeat-associated protein
MTNSTVLLATFFGRKRIGTFDRLGSAKYNQNNAAQSFYPYGEDRGTMQPNDSLKFATYTRDAATGLDYADQRYYASNWGRFMRPDPSGRSLVMTNPESWNRYAYVNDDPINSNDPTGLCDAVFAGITQSAPNSSSFQAFADNDSAISIYPYSSHSDNSSALGKLGNVLYGITQVAAQAFGPNSSTYAGVVGLEIASLAGVPINAVAFSGGAASFTSAVSFLNSQGAAGQAVVAMINQITYVAPGNVGPLYNNGDVSVIGGGAVNWLVGLTTSVPAGATRYTDMNHCGHDFNCLANEFPQAFTSGAPCPVPLVVNQNRSIGRFGATNSFYWMNLIFGNYSPDEDEDEDDE